MPVNDPPGLPRWRERRRTIIMACVSVAIFIPIGALLWLTLVGITNPVYSDRLLSVEPADRVLDRDLGARLVIRRELCSRRAGQAVVSRDWMELDENDEVSARVAYSTFTIDLVEGCRTATVSQRVPRNLAPGLYSYVTSVRACPVLTQCPKFDLSPIPVAILGGPWPKAVVPPPPPMVLPKPIVSNE